MKYTHRNGEYDLPTVEGNYWIRYPNGTGIGTNLVHVINEGTFWTVYSMGTEDASALEAYANTEWWGPITAPWEGEL